MGIIAKRIRLVGYESRGIGIVTQDTNSNHKFFTWCLYSGSNINYTIGYHPSSEDYKTGYLSTHVFVKMVDMVQLWLLMD